MRLWSAARLRRRQALDGGLRARGPRGQRLRVEGTSCEPQALSRRREPASSLVGGGHVLAARPLHTGEPLGHHRALGKGPSTSVPRPRCPRGAGPGARSRLRAGLTVGTSTRRHCSFPITEVENTWKDAAPCPELVSPRQALASTSASGNREQRPPHGAGLTQRQETRRASGSCEASVPRTSARGGARAGPCRGSVCGGGGRAPAKGGVAGPHPLSRSPPWRRRRAAPPEASGRRPLCLLSLSRGRCPWLVAKSPRSLPPSRGASPQASFPFPCKGPRSPRMVPSQSSS